MANEAFARVKMDQLLKDTDWSLEDGRIVRFEYPLDDGGNADYALFDCRGRALAALEARGTSVNLRAGEAQGQRYADQLDVSFNFLSNGEEVGCATIAVPVTFPTPIDTDTTAHAESPRRPRTTYARANYQYRVGRGPRRLRADVGDSRGECRPSL